MSQGVSSISPELSGKRLELLREVVPGLSRVAFLWNPDIRGAVFDYN
jgi:putative ABC transport system substrate-binding protein